MLKLLSSQQGKMLTLVATHTTLLCLLFNSRVNLNSFWSRLGQGFFCSLVSLQLLSIYSWFNSVEVLWGTSSPLSPILIESYSEYGPAGRQGRDK